MGLASATAPIPIDSPEVRAKFDRRKQKGSGGGEEGDMEKKKAVIVPAPPNGIKPRAKDLSMNWPYVVSWRQLYNVLNNAETLMMGTLHVKMAEDFLKWLVDNTNSDPLGLYVLTDEGYVAVEVMDGGNKLIEVYPQRAEDEGGDV